MLFSSLLALDMYAKINIGYKIIFIAELYYLYRDFNKVYIIIKSLHKSYGHLLPEDIRKKISKFV